MGRYEARMGRDYKIETTAEGVENLVITDSALKRFTADILELGDLSKSEPKTIQALCAFLDLEGFTALCKQPEPGPNLHRFMKEFLYFIFEQIKKDNVDEGAKSKQGTVIWLPFPFFAKFMGDGLLLLWDVYALDVEYVANICINTVRTCDAYRDTFYPTIKKRVKDAPASLRCGIARGTIISIGEEKDYAGVCINIAARLQKIAPGVSTAIWENGLDFLEKLPFGRTLVLKRYPIRGISDGELIYLRKKEFSKLGNQDKGTFSNP